MLLNHVPGRLPSHFCHQSRGWIQVYTFDMTHTSGVVRYFQHAKEQVLLPGHPYHKHTSLSRVPHCLRLLTCPRIMQTQAFSPHVINLQLQLLKPPQTDQHWKGNGLRFPAWMQHQTISSTLLSASTYFSHRTHPFLGACIPCATPQHSSALSEDCSRHQPLPSQVPR